MYSGCFTVPIRCYIGIVLLHGMPHIPAFSCSPLTLRGFLIMRLVRRAPRHAASTCPALLSHRRLKW